MSVKSRLMLRGTTVALLLSALVPVAAVPVAFATDVVGPSEQSMGQGPPGAVSTTLVLRPVCTSGDLHRFAVVNEAGPATRFTVEVAAATAEPLAIAPGATVRFWVSTEDDAPVEISWPDGSAAATPAQDACPSERDVPTAAAEPAPDEGPAARPAPSASSEHVEQARPADPARPATPPDSRSTDPSARDARDAADPEDPATPPPTPEGPTVRTPTADAAEAGVAPGDGRTTPRPQPSGAAFTCPDQWVAVDSDGDGRIDGADECEVVVETGAGGRRPGAMFTTAALVITLGLLITSVAAGAVSRRGPSPRAR